MTISTEQVTIAPHGGELVDRRAPEQERDELLRRAAELRTVTLRPNRLSDLEMISTGVFSPLTGFMVREDYENVVESMHLKNGLAWSLPITLSVSEEEARSIDEGEQVALADEGGRVVATMLVEDVYPYDKEREVRNVYKTDDEAHPGVAAVYRQKEVYIGGEVTLLVDEPSPRPFPNYYFEPAEMRKVFAEKGWKKVVGFQTRNPVHRAHEYIQKSALEIVDGLLLNPLVGETKADDFPVDVRMKSYEVILDRYFPKGRTMLGVFPATMRFGGPREAVFHALCRKNYGCTHFIVGRQHAQVGNYYGDYDAHYIFDEFEPGEIGTTPLFYEHAFFCLDCQGMGTAKTCPHDAESHVFLSGTKVRAMVAEGEYPPPEFSRPEVIEVLMEGQRTSDMPPGR